MNLAPGFSRHATHLLCPSGVGAKFEKAQEWGTPIVAVGWLEEIARMGRITAVTTYLVSPGRTVVDDVQKGEPVMDMDVDANGNLYEKVGGDMNGRGKQKAGDKGKATEDLRVGDSPIDGMEGSVVVSPNLIHFFKGEIISSSRHDTPPIHEAVEHQILQPGLSFGGTNGSLARPQSTQPPPRSLSSTSVRVQSPPLITRQDSCTRSDTSNSSDVVPRNPTPMEIERERKQARIPSSKSPSPMKIPHANISTPRRAPKRQETRRLSVSPTKLTREASKALKDNITSLLGKRQPSAGDTSEAINLRAGKRPRPQRSKVCFRCYLAIFAYWG